MELYSCGYEITSERVGVIAPVYVIQQWETLIGTKSISIDTINAQIDLRNLLLHSYWTNQKEYFVPVHYLVTYTNEFANNGNVLYDSEKAKHRVAFVLSIERFMMEYNAAYWKGFLYSLKFKS